MESSRYSSDRSLRSDAPFSPDRIESEAFLGGQKRRQPRKRDWKKLVGLFSLVCAGVGVCLFVLYASVTMFPRKGCSCIVSQDTKKSFVPPGEPLLSSLSKSPEGC